MGGRGGEVLAVTNLNDAGPGSLRAAVESPGPRTVVFRVAGTIELQSPIEIDDPYLTVAGQTSPGGICISGADILFSPLFLGTHDVIIRHVRFRAGGNATGPFKDAASLGEGVGEIDRVIFDHCSFSWANDETFQIWTDQQPANNVTLQHSIISEGLNYDGHSRGVIAGSNTICEQMTAFSVHHNLMAHNAGRNPYVKVSSTEIVSNIIYNWDFLATQLAGGIKADVVANRYIPGFDTGTPPVAEIAHRMSPEPWLGCNWGPPGDPSVLIAENLGPNTQPGVDQYFTMADLVGRGNGWGWPPSPITGEPVRTRLPAAWQRGTRLKLSGFPVTVTAAARLEDELLPTVGASSQLDHFGNLIDARDAVDARVVDSVRNRTGQIIDRESDVGGYPAIVQTEPYPDADNDGMSDLWEILRGLDPTDPDDRNLDADADGYTNLEEFLNASWPTRWRNRVK